MWSVLSILGLAAQVPLESPPMAAQTSAAARRPINHDFKFKEAADVFAPKDLVELARPGTGIPNAPGDLVLVSSSKYLFKDKKCVETLSTSSPS
jgi:hypothetical protein